MAERILPTPDQLRQLLRYEPDTGKLFWKERPESMFYGLAYPAKRLAKVWNSKYADKEAMTAVRGSGYRTGRVFSRQYQAHRVAWAIYHGTWPSKDIDHINGNPGDNSISNLRLATVSENMRNTRIRSDNKSGIKGVFWAERYGKWEAQIAVHGKSIALGRFSDIGDAAAAYRNAAEKLHGEFARHS